MTLLHAANLPSSGSPGSPEDVSSPLPDARRRFVYVMAFRIGLVTFLLALLVALSLLGGIPMQLATLHAFVLSAVIAAAYLSGLAFALRVRRFGVSRPVVVSQVVLDVLLVSVLVHLTGGINSAWTFLYPLVIVEAAVVALKTGALWTMMLTAVAFLGTAVGGFLGWVPAVAGQMTLPWQASPEELGYGLLINLAAQVAIATLAAFLGDQLERASAQVAEQQETIRDMARLNATILESLPLGVVTLDAEGHVLATNPAADRLLGQDLRGRSHRDLAVALPDDLAELARQAPAHQASAHQASAHRAPAHPGRVQRRQGRLPESLGGRPVQVTASPFGGMGEGGQGVILVLEDQSEIRAMKERVSQAERLAAVGRLAAAIAHEIRNPLSSVSGSLEMLHSAPGLDPEDQKLLEIAMREVSRLEELITSLLSYARPHPPVPMPFDVAALVTELKSQAARDPLFEKVEIATRFHGPTHVEADPDQVRQVLWNLLRNAAEAMPQGGTVGVQVRWVEAPDGLGAAAGLEDADGLEAPDGLEAAAGLEAGTGSRAIAEGASPPARAGSSGAVEIQVTDQGEGMDAEAQAHLFEPFFTTKDKGTGLGLATVHRIVAEHGGQVTVQSAVGEGTTVRVLLPASPSGGP